MTGTGGATIITEDKGTLQMVADVSPENASNKTVTWSVDDESIATISSSGLLTAKANGTATVKATAKDGSGVVGSAVITISNQVTPPETFKVSVAGDAAEATDYTISGADNLAEVEDGTELTITAVTDITINGEEVAAEGTKKFTITEAITITINKKAVIPPTGYKVTFKDTNSVDLSSATIVVKDSSNVEVSNLDEVTNGNYTYIINLAGYEEATGNFTVADTDKEVSVTLEEVVTPDPEVYGSMTAYEDGAVIQGGNNYTATFGGEVKWYDADANVGRTAGNRVGVKISAPADFDTSDIVQIKIGDKDDYTWENIKDGDGSYFEWWPLVTEAGQEFTATIKWNSASEQTFKIVISNDATLEAAPAIPDPEVIESISVAARTSATNGDKITVGDVTGSDKEFAVAITGLDGMTTVTGNPGGVATEGKWFGIQLAPAGVTDITKLKYKTAIQNEFAALTAADAAEAGADGQIVWWINGDADVSQNIWLKYAGEDDATAIKLTINYTAYKEVVVPEVTGGITAFGEGATVDGDKVTFADVEIPWYEADETVGRNVAGNRVGVKIVAPAEFTADDLGKDKVSVVIGEKTYDWSVIQDGEFYFEWWPLVTKTETQELTAVVKWNEKSEQTFTIAIGENVTLAKDPNAPVVPEVTGSIVAFGEGATVDGDKVTFAGVEIPWYEADETVGRNVAGNRVGVKIVAPAEFTADDLGKDKVSVVIGEKTYDWSVIQDGEFYFEWWPLITKTDAQELTAVVKWNEKSEQTFTIAIGENVTLEVAPDTEVPKLGEVTLTNDEFGNLVLTVSATDNGELASLEVDHSLDGQGVPEFTVGTQNVTDPTTGASSTFADGTWTLNFGPTMSGLVREKTDGKITFYFVIKDVAGNQFGDMYNVTPGMTRTFDVPAAPEVEVASTYKFSYTAPEKIVEGEEVAIDVTFGTEVKGDFGYNNVRFKFAATGPEGANATFKATDTNNVEHTFVNEGYWGPASNFNIPADYTATTNWKVTFSKAGEYTITFSLIDAASEEVIAGITGSEVITVVEVEIEEVASTYSFDFNVPEVKVGEEATINVTFANDEPAGDYGYEGIRFKFTKVSGSGNATFTAMDSIGNPYTATNEGYWGPGSGFDINAKYSATTPWAVTFDTAGTYVFEVSLIYAVSDAVVEGITETVTVNVVAGEPSIPELTVTGPSAEVAGDANNFEVTFVVNHDKELERLEIDHNLGSYGSVPESVKLPEFKLYPNAVNPWATPEMQDAEARKQNAESQGLLAAYKANEKTWTLTFVNPVLGQIRNLTEAHTNNEFRIYSVVRDVEGIQSGSMYDGSYKTTVVTLAEEASEAPQTFTNTFTTTVTEAIGSQGEEGTDYNVQGWDSSPNYIYTTDGAFYTLQLINSEGNLVTFASIFEEFTLQTDGSTNIHKYHSGLRNQADFTGATFEGHNGTAFLSDQGGTLRNTNLNGTLFYGIHSDIYGVNIAEDTAIKIFINGTIKKDAKKGNYNLKMQLNKPTRQDKDTKHTFEEFKTVINSPVATKEFTLSIN